MSNLECDGRKQIDQDTSNNTAVLTVFVVTFSLFFDSLPASPLINDSLPTEFSLEETDDDLEGQISIILDGHLRYSYVSPRSLKANPYKPNVAAQKK
jgi:hypothetical protein